MQLKMITSRRHLSIFLSHVKDVVLQPNTQQVFTMTDLRHMHHQIIVEEGVETGKCRPDLLKCQLT